MKLTGLLQTRAVIAALALLAPACSQAAPAEATAVTQVTPAAPPAATAADILWEDVLRGSRPPTQPEEWRTTPPTEAVIEKFRKEAAGKLIDTAGKARELFTKYPDFKFAQDARTKEFELLMTAFQLGITTIGDKIDLAEKELLAQKGLEDDMRFRIRFMSIQRRAMAREAEGMAALMEELAKGYDVMKKEFPGRPELTQLLANLVSGVEGPKLEGYAKELLASNAPEQAKMIAQDTLYHLGLVGKPVAVKFKALDGSQVDLASYKGKVVLLDFWATWCGPCMRELPHVKAAYEKFKDKGFAIIGLSLDEDKAALKKTVAEKGMSWPQHFDESGESTFAKQFKVHSIPNMWLVDKKCNLREIRAGADLEKKIAKYLAE